MDNYVGTLPGVIQRKKAVYSSSRWEAMEAMQDLQADINADIGFDGMDKMIRLCLSHKIPQTSGFFSQQTLLELRATHQMCARHDDLRAEVFAHMFARMATRVGAAGMPMLCCVVDGGKTNKNGNISYSAILPHANPLHWRPTLNALKFFTRAVERGSVSWRWTTSISTRFVVCVITCMMISVLPTS